MKYLVFILSLVVIINCLADIKVIPSVVINPTINSHYKTNTKTVSPHKVIDALQIKASGAQTIQQLLSSNGIYIENLESADSKSIISMRGFGSNAEQNMLILLNGHPLHNPDLEAARLNAIPVTSVKRIEINNGSAGVLYGDQAVGGMINIITKQSKHASKLILGYGSYNSKKISGELYRTKHGINYGLTLSYDSSAGFRTHSKNSNIDLSSSLHKQFTKSELSLRYLFNRQYLQYSGALYHPTPNSYNHQYNHRLLEDYATILTPNWELNLNSTLGVMIGSGKTPLNFSKNRYDVNLQPSLNGMINLGNYTILNTTGIAFTTSQYNFNYPSYHSRAKQNISSAFSKLTLPLSHSLKLSAGARAAQADAQQSLQGTSYNSNNHAFITTLGLSWQPSSSWQLFLRRAGSYRFPKTDENIFTSNNKPLKTQTGISYEGGILFQTPSFHSMLELYQLQLHNEIITIPEPAQGMLVENTNLPATKRLGLAFNITKKLFQYWQLGGSYNYVHGRFSSGPYKGKRIPFVPDNNFAVNLTYTPCSIFNIYLEAIYKGKTSYADDPEQLAPMLAPYTLYNLALNYRYHHAFFNLRLNNITNVHYYGYAFTTYRDNNYQPYYYPAPGINGMLTMTIEY